jgi:hypothetical protein
MKVNGYEIGPFADLPHANLRGVNLKGADLKHANLKGADLWKADFEDANLWGADLRGANLRGANLRGVDLMDANLKGADLWNADFGNADLPHANLMYAHLPGVNLKGANLHGANFMGANLRNVDLRGARLPAFQIVPQEGDFIGYKKLRNDLICKLLITGERTSSLVGRKCRCSRAQVLEVYDNAGVKYPEGVSLRSPYFRYKVGNEVCVFDYNPDIRVECSTGIHFFITEQEAIDFT